MQGSALKDVTGKNQGQEFNLNPSWHHYVTTFSPIIAKVMPVAILDSTVERSRERSSRVGCGDSPRHAWKCKIQKTDTSCDRQRQTSIKVIKQAMDHIIYGYCSLIPSEAKTQPSMTIQCPLNPRPSFLGNYSLWRLAFSLLLDSKLRLPQLHVIALVRNPTPERQGQSQPELHTGTFDDDSIIQEKRHGDIVSTAQVKITLRIVMPPCRFGDRPNFPSIFTCLGMAWSRTIQEVNRSTM
ncbi:hypothetical protein BU15DRAFT_61659 [Melanogaster broomeanus]|nr:hypothetical protein BU15DRAFT_61659 [Melanogaster broomeanus]